MNTTTLMKAIGGVNDSFVTDLLNEKPCIKKVAARRRRFWIAAAACLCLVIGSFLYWNSKETALNYNFSITAYAKEQSRDNLGKVLKLSEPAPIDVYYSDDGQAMFVFSYEAASPDTPASSFFVADYDKEPDVFPAAPEIVTGIEELPGRIYVYYLPSQMKAAPYRFDIIQIIPDQKGDTLCASLRITSENDQYYVELEEMSEKAIYSYFTTNSYEVQKTDHSTTWVFPGGLTNK